MTFSNRSRVIACAIAMAGLAVAVSASRRHEQPSALVRQGLKAHPPEHRSPTINGAIQPQLISDERALSLLFLMAASPDARMGRSYVKHLFKDRTGAYAVSNETAEGIRRIAEAYAAEVKQLHAAAGTDTPFQVAEALERNRTKFVDLLGPGGADRLATLLATRIKPNARVFVKP